MNHRQALSVAVVNMPEAIELQLCDWLISYFQLQSFKVSEVKKLPLVGSLFTVYSCM